jgi:hypothetical protein
MQSYNTDLLMLIETNLQEESTDMLLSDDHNY